MIWLLSAWLTLAGADEPRFEALSRPLSVSLGVGTRAYEFDFLGPTDVKFAPNLRGLTTIGVNYAGIGALTYETRNSVAEENLSKGDSHYDDIRLSLPFRQLAIFLYYARYQGFYVANSSAIDGNLPASKPYLLYPDMYAQNFGGSFTWAFNSEAYSLAAAMDMSERQIRPGGSWLLGASAGETFFRNTAEILPKQVRADYARDGGIREGRLRSLSIKGGYGYTYAWRRRYFVSGLVQAGAGPQDVLVRTSEDSFTDASVKLNSYELYFGGGFNGETCFAGLGALFLANDFKVDTARISTQMTTVSLFFGLRVDPAWFTAGTVNSKRPN